MTTVTSAGVGSGLDLEALIRASVDAENTPRIASIERRERLVNLELSNLGQIRSGLSSFNSVLDTLKDLSNFQNRTATVRQPEDGDVISVSATDTATAGRFDVTVQQLAQGSRAVQADASAYSATTDVVTASGGTLTFSAGAQSFQVTVGANATLADLRTAINESTDNFGVSANIINTGGASSLSKLVFTSNETGAGNDLTVTADTAELDRVSTTAFGGGAGGMAIAATDQARDAILEIDGITTVSSTNTFQNAIQDTTITALREDPANSARLTVAPDEEGIRETLQSFVDSYNSLLDTLNNAIDVRSADATARGIRTSVINQLSSIVSGAGNFQSIFDIGIEMGEGNRLSIRNSGPNTLTDAFEEFDDIGKLFAGPTGIATLLADTIDPYLESGGIIRLQQDSLNRQTRDLENERANQAFRIEQFERRLRDQYANLDVTIASLRSQGSAITSALANLPGFTTNSN